MASTTNYTFTYDDREVALVNHLPPILRPIYDFRGLCDANGMEVGTLYSHVKQLLDNQFIATASSDMIAKWEKYMRITPNATDTLEERKFRILARLNDLPPYTDTYLEKKLDELCGKNCWRIFRDYDKYELTIQLTAGTPANTKTVSDLLRQIIPANMKLVVQNFRVRHSELTTLSHSALNKYTHEQIKYLVAE